MNGQATALRCRRAVVEGVSLIELLVLVAILATLATVAVVGLSGLGGGREMEQQARRFQALVQLACERAALSGREHGLALGRRGYAFQVPSLEGWRTLNQGELRPRRLPDGFSLSAWRDGLALELEESPGAQPQALCSPAGELLPFEARIEYPGVPPWTVTAQADGKIDVRAAEPGR